MFGTYMRLPAVFQFLAGVKAAENSFQDVTIRKQGPYQLVSAQVNAKRLYGQTRYPRAPTEAGRVINNLER